jgi:FKBP-type peptidyl-prolyl cis-trans isomerase FkpA
MKFISLLFLCSIISGTLFCQKKLNKEIYTIPDSISAVTYYAEIKIADSSLSKNYSKNKISGITANEATVGLAENKGQKLIHFYFFDKHWPDAAFGKDVYKYSNGFAFNYNWQYGESYPLVIAMASDSAAHQTLCSGYIFLPKEKKWKLLATKSYDDTLHIKSTGSIQTKNIAASLSNRWLQRSNGSWKVLDAQTTKPPSLRQMSNIDSLAQQQMEEAMLRGKLPKDSVVYEEGMFYKTLATGTGRLVKVTDTLTVHYRGSLFNDGSVFDETNDKPATFSLERLIKGWQLGLVHCRVGGKMRLYLPSGSAYGIRTRAADIPPNSILVFDVEVLDAKEKIVNNF